VYLGSLSFLLVIIEDSWIEFNRNKDETSAFLRKDVQKHFVCHIVSKLFEACFFLPIVNWRQIQRLSTG